MAFGLDYATGNVDARCLRNFGARFVCRYLAPPGSIYDWKRLTSGEVERITQAGLGLVLVFESSAARARGGRPAGKADSATARDAVIRLGLPPGAPVYFAVDFDATPGDQAAINAYLDGAAEVIGRNRVGIYGGFYPVRRALDAGKARYAWQTYAWSGGQWDPRAHIQQYSNGHRVCGISVDYDRSMTDDFGQVGYKPPVARLKFAYATEEAAGNRLGKTNYPALTVARVARRLKKGERIVIERL